MRGVRRSCVWRVVVAAVIVFSLPAAASAQSWSWRDDGQYGIWSWGTTDRFRYDYSASQWWDYTTFGDWQKLGAVGASPVTREQGVDLEHFIGNGTWRDLLTGWYYSYDSTCAGGVGVSLWRDNTDPFRFSYCYATGQWNDFSWYSSGYWTGLGTQGRSQVFIGDGGWYNLGISWEYQYATSTNMGCGLWRDNTDPLRFSYCYNTGQWNDFSFYTPGYWSGIGQGAMSAAFIGNGDWHGVGNGWAYSYTTVSNVGVSLWRDNTAPMRFSYCYNTGQWNDFSFYTPGYWSGIGSGAMSAAFIGDGGWYDLGTGWSFHYRSSLNGYSVWRNNDDGMQFSYGYLYGMWNDYYAGTDTWHGLGLGGLSSAFIGDGEWHDVGVIGKADWRYQYASGVGGWQRDIDDAWTDRFQYAYGSGQWSHKGATTAWGTLSVTGVSNAFVGDGETHNLGNGFSYYYTSSGDNGWFKVGGHERFWYKYSPSQWYHSGNTAGWAALTAGGYSAAFVGDGAWHDLGDGWTYAYDIGVDSGYFKVGAARRFSYSYGPSQWFHTRDTAYWTTLSAAGVSAQFIGDGGWHDIGHGFTYQYLTANEEGYFKVGDSERLLYEYGPGQWCHKGNTTSWMPLSGLNYSAQFIGDGAWYDLGSGWKYSYSAASDYGIFKDGDTDRFSYSYSPSQWLHKGNTTAWGALSAAGISAEFVGDGGSHDVGNGFTFVYSTANKEGYFEFDDSERFSYSYGPSQWYHKGDATAWGTLSVADISAEFVGDGGWHDVGNGFSYSYSSANDYGYFKVGAVERFSFSYGPSKWYHKGNTTQWVALTGGNFSPQFIGDGQSHELGNGWKYSYSAADDDGIFKDGDTERFSYSYSPSQWLHKGDTTPWGALSAAGVFAEFVGDGGSHDLGNGFTYQYVRDTPGGYFQFDATVRFSYNYGSSQWFHKGDTTNWGALSATGVSAEFVGDGQWHAVGNGFTYCYSSASDHGYFNVPAGWRYYYDYQLGQWLHRGNTTAWLALTTGNFSAQFVGDGAEHNLGNGWLFSYLRASDYGVFSAEHGAAVLAYSYVPGRWFHKGETTAWAALTATNYSLAFIGDGAWHDLGFGNGWSYSYVSASDDGRFQKADTQRFSYSYGPSQWYHKGDATDWGALSATDVSALFIGDGGWYGLGNGFTYQYSADNKEGYFKVGDAERIYYTYGDSQWFHKGDTMDWVALTAENYSAQFVGDGQWHFLGAGFLYQYVTAADEGHFMDVVQERFSYHYGPSQWYHKGDTTNWGALSAEGVSGEFVGDGGSYDLHNGSTYQYVAANKEGYFKVGDTERYYYDYGPSRWYHKGNTTGWGALSAEGVSAEFVGDGEWHDVGAGFTYCHVGGDSGYFKKGDSLRFSYWYVESQWFHKGDTTDLTALTGSNYSARFIGDGEWHNLGNGWSYSYLSTSDYGAFMSGDGQAEFAFSYAPGRWLHKADWASAWGALTAANYSIAFIGDGQWHDLGFGNGSVFQYVAAGDEGYFKVGDTERFSYDYELGQWFHKGNTTAFGELSARFFSAEYVGDGEWHDLGNGLTYQYLSASEEGYFKADADERFLFRYDISQWLHKGNTTDWVGLGLPSLSAQFIGDGGRHDLGNGFTYQYVAAGDEGHYYDDLDDRFSYHYDDSQWYHTTRHWDWVVLSAEGLSAEFVGDGNWYDLGNGWSYHYILSIHTAYWGRDSDWDNQRFNYNYDIGLWNHKGTYGDFHPLGSHHWWNPSFLGDGEEHAVNDDGSRYTYHYRYDLDHGYWDFHGDGTDSWKYYYDTGYWYQDYGHGWQYCSGPRDSTITNNPQ